MTLRGFREFVNLKLYSSKKYVLPIFKSIIVVVSIVAAAALVYYYGFPHSEESRNILLTIVQTSFGFYILNFVVKILYTYEPRKFFRKNWFEGLLMLFLIVEGISYNFFDSLVLSRLFIGIGIEKITDYYTIFIQMYFLVVVFVQIARTSTILPSFKLHPSLIFILSFLALIVGGTVLLMLPEMTVQAGSMELIDAFFTSTSATCVTGLIVEDTATFFTFKGQFVLLILIKLGGLNIIAFGSFLALMAKFGVGVKHHSVIEDFVNKESFISAKGMLGRVIIWSFAIEIIGTLLLYYSWNDALPFETSGDRLFFSLFHSFSAFNNAGFSLMTDGLFNDYLKYNYLTHNIISLLVFLGALGFVAMFDLFGWRNIKNRIENPWKQITFSTKIALNFSLALVVLGTVLFYVLEANNTLADHSFIGKVTTSLFQSVTRTSGFNTVDIAALGIPMTIVMLFLMFVGSSSSSTGGGIKTSTFALLWATTISTIRSKKNIELFKKTISNDLVFRAFAVFVFFVVGNLICIFLLSITESDILNQANRSILDIIFEEVSAFGTVGLSTGITSELSPIGKIIIIASMFIGRIGTLTVAFALGKKAISTGYKYPQGHTMVG